MGRSDCDDLEGGLNIEVLAAAFPEPELGFRLPPLPLRGLPLFDGFSDNSSDWSVLNDPGK